MPTISVSGFNPDGGPSQLSAQATRDNLNEDHPAWAVTLAYDANNVTATFTSTTASDADLRAALETAYPSASYRVV
ncbi:TPA: hypothetical protein QDA74_005685 [Burkholderia territorii]|uniref:hypothetical protein n=1 Tax=Burkholderia territorii TaxID=1503055 RepID=UPI0007553420|nr:hypothetical protein [Burkholderia territorii]KVL33017.1 hypothetical protein WS97_20565 [Burkholderia territorii]KWH07144.1 hypothetical protein WT58_13445 [Burkholderia territorii]KWO50336.1 hypothetical protein WT98_14640 [Burkholderia territorii]TXG11060.1 hypothetical protein FU139_21255 [Burkholderia territorii]HDR8859986.1 hypothetical protein [Burkholderia territorii]